MFRKGVQAPVALLYLFFLLFSQTDLTAAPASQVGMSQNVTSGAIGPPGALTSYRLKYAVVVPGSVVRSFTLALG